MSIYSKLYSLLTAANTTTGESDTTLTDAIQTLIDGYGQGGGDVEFAHGTITLASDTNADIPVEVGFDPQFAIEWTDPYEMEVASSAAWYGSMIFVDRLDEYSNGILQRHYNNSYGETVYKVTNTDLGTYANGVYTFPRHFNHMFLSGWKIRWCCWRINNS